MKIAILGASGMLGSMLTKYALLEGKVEVVPFSRKKLAGKLEKVKVKEFNPSNFEVDESFDCIVNCCGVVKQRVSSANEMFAINADFPKRLAEIHGKKFLHISTDCVFSGRNGNHVENDEKDCSDDYGLSKSEGENHEGRVLRTSIIGVHETDRAGLLEWYRNSQGVVNGYVDHYWSGVTTLRLSQIIMSKITASDPRLLHVYSNKVSKFDLLQDIKKVFGVKTEIHPQEAGRVDRSLSSMFESNFTNGDILQQLVELAEFERVKI
jgi:dTDP-4-dehydrorhamnose reductase